MDPLDAIVSGTHRRSWTTREMVSELDEMIENERSDFAAFKQASRENRAIALGKIKSILLDEDDASGPPLNYGGVIDFLIKMSNEEEGRAQRFRGGGMARKCERRSDCLDAIRCLFLKQMQDNESRRHFRRRAR